MSLAVQRSPEAENNVAETQLVSGAESGVDDSSMLADLMSMFPNLDHDVAVVVLEEHNGSLEAAVEYLLNSNKSNGSTQPTIAAGGGYERLGYLDPACDMVGQFSADIGGLPEVLPRCLYDEVAQENEEEEGDHEDAEGSEQPRRRDALPQQGTLNWLEESDPLPTYAEACRDRSAQVGSPPQSEGSAENDRSTLNPVEGASEKQASANSSKSKC